MGKEITRNAPKGKPRGKPFAKGTTLNPHGSPLWVRELRALAGSHAPEAIATLLELMRTAKSEVRKGAADSLLDRAGLKAYSLEPEKIELTTNAGDDALSRFAALIGRRLAAVPTTPDDSSGSGGCGKDGPKTT
jgi:hypothetical protein